MNDSTNYTEAQFSEFEAAYQAAKATGCGFDTCDGAEHEVLEPAEKWSHRVALADFGVGEIELITRIEGSVASVEFRDADEYTSDGLRKLAAELEAVPALLRKFAADLDARIGIKP